MLYSIELRSRLPALPPDLSLLGLLDGYALFLDAGLLAGQVAEVEDAGATHFTDLVDGDAVDCRGLEGENPLHSDAVGDLTHGESAGQGRGTADLYYHSAEILQTELVAFLDFAGNGDGVAGLEFGILCNVLVYKGFFCYFK